MKKLGWLGSFAVYAPAALLLYLATAFVIPYLSRVTGQESIFFWFLVAGLGVFVPLILTAVLILRSEGRRLNKPTWVERMRFRRLTKKDLIWALGGLLLTGAASGLLMKGAELIAGSYDPTPPFMAFEPLGPGRYWLLAVWLPFWILNILGEEILWRGVLLPRQEIAFGKKAWIVHAWADCFTSPSAAASGHADPLAFHPVLRRSEDEKLLGGSHHARRSQRPELPGDRLRLALTTFSRREIRCLSAERIARPFVSFFSEDSTQDISHYFSHYTRKKRKKGAQRDICRKPIDFPFISWIFVNEVWGPFSQLSAGCFRG